MLGQADVSTSAGDMAASHKSVADNIQTNQRPICQDVQFPTDGQLAGNNVQVSCVGH